MRDWLLRQDQSAIHVAARSGRKLRLPGNLFLSGHGKEFNASHDSPERPVDLICAALALLTQLSPEKSPESESQLSVVAFLGEILPSVESGCDRPSSYAYS